MTTKILSEQDKTAFNRIVTHPLQSWEWGEFRKQSGLTVERLGFFKGQQLVSGIQVSFHQIPFTHFTIGYIPKGPLPTQEQIEALKDLGSKHNAVFIQLEPNVIKQSAISNPPAGEAGQRSDYLKPSARPLFTRYTFHIDLTKSEEELLKSFHSKTRYNIRVAQKHEVTIQEENTEEAFAAYLALTQETTKRQGFYAHTPGYHKLMWETLHHANIAHLLTARYQGQIITTWIVFVFNHVLYYPYGASTQQHKEVMASNLMMWEAIRWGKMHGAKLFDLWGTPGPDPKPTDPYYGFHRFKLGYNPQLVEFVGSYDLVLKQPHYQLFTIADKLRWTLLRLKAKF